MPDERRLRHMRRLCAKLNHCHAAVHMQGLAGHIGGFRAGEKHRGCSDFGSFSSRPAHSAQYPPFLRVRERVRHRAFDKSGRYAVHGYSARRHLRCEGLAHPDHAGLGGGIIALPRIPVTPTTEVMPMTRPWRLRIIPRKTARESRKAEVRFTFSTASQSSSSTS